MGDPAGIGGELTLKAWLARDRCPPFLAIDDPERLAFLAKALELPVPIRIVASSDDATAIFPEALPVLAEPLIHAAIPGQPDPANAEAVIGSIRKAVRMALDGDAAAVVTNPIHKKSLADAGFPHPGHTEFLAELTGRDRAIMMLACPALRVVPVTVHLPLAEAIRRLDAETLVEAGRITAEALRRDFAIEAPRLSVAALNPHAGEDGLLGDEERRIIAPAVARLKQAGVTASGPHPADSLFHPRARTLYDAVLCLYHDQALIPLKTIDFDHGVDITLGLPIIRTSPDHGTAFDIAGLGVASAESLLSALCNASVMAANRAASDARDKTGPTAR